MKLAVVFPGIGYHCDKPLLFYAKKLAMKQGYTIREVSYGELPKNAKGDTQKLAECCRVGLASVTAQLEDIDWNACEDVLLITKSLGTVISAEYAGLHIPHCRSIWYTPVTPLFPLARDEGIVFHGTKDPLAVTSEILQGCKEKAIPCYLIEGGNHSLETGDVLADIANLRDIMDRTNRFILANGKR